MVPRQFSIAKKATFVTILIVIIAIAEIRNCIRHSYGDELIAPNAGLRVIYMQWLAAGRPARWDIKGLIEDEYNRYFDYTNVFVVDHGVCHCRFGCEAPNVPTGILAITDEGRVIWIRQRDVSFPRFSGLPSRLGVKHTSTYEQTL